MTAPALAVDHPALGLAATVLRAQTMRIGALSPAEIRGALFALESLELWLVQIADKTDGGDAAVKLLRGLISAMHVVVLLPQTRN